ncbi:LamG-like jellyroll fold domain-containing protein [Tichowtungia aerotolerans]|uniref:Uncharacterized protein n=1 Tax=Tichowtungia aerotolerans TaxID=2697043 RepID=A0A6P1M6B9_9BACT|nr:LamG-like jellyroll fold domain-containing protein [Tichowtungia aerotolerans]QHI69407.1 hypothetical protein GT409_08055 [Tichowtungia aerotolerans]
MRYTGVIVGLLMAAGILCAEDVSARWGFDGTDRSSELSWTGAASVETLPEKARQGVVSLELPEDRAILNSGLIAEQFADKNWSLSLLFRHDRLPPDGEGAGDSMILFQSDRLTVALRRGNDGGNAGKIFATLNADQGKTLFKPNVRVDDGRWHEFALRADAEKKIIQVFLDGKLYSDRDFEGTALLFEKNGLFEIGPGAGSQVDELRIFNTALSDPELFSSFKYALCGMDKLGPAQGINSVRILLSPDLPEPCRFYAERFAAHLMLRAPAVRVAVDFFSGGEQPVANELLLCASIAADDELSPGPEGYAVGLAAAGDGYQGRVIGADARGVLYGLGRLLYLSEKAGPWIRWPEFNEASAPRVALRSMNGSFKHSMDSGAAKKTGARAWSEEEGIAYWEEYLFLGVNAYTYGRGRVPPVNLEKYTQSAGVEGVSLKMDQLCTSYGMACYYPQSVNGLGKANMKSGWNALSRVGRLDPHLACPSVPEARAAILQVWEAYAEECGNLDFVTLKSADLGGCHCEKCREDWAAVFYNLCCDIARSVHQWKPGAKVYFTNQEMNMEENERLFRLMREDEECPLTGYVYSPGGSENSTYGYILKNPRWDRYPGISPNTTFLKSRLSYLRPDQDILVSADITHWKRAGSAVPYVDPLMSEIYARRTYNARPKNYEKVFRERMPYSNGFIGYSEGIFDDFNKFLMLRLSWNPDLSAEEIASEYYTYHCGPDAGRLLARAVFIGERIREKPFRSCGENIRRYRELVQKAGECMPPEYRTGNWRYGQMVVRSLVDSYVWQRSEFQRQQVEQAGRILNTVLRSGDPAEEIRSAVSALSQSFESDLPAQARAADDEVDAAIGIRCFALTKMERIDSAGVFWLKAQLEPLLQETDAAEMTDRLMQILNYDKVGPGEFYDNCGTIDQQPHYDFDSGELYYGTGSWPQETRPSQRWYNYSFEAQDGLGFFYEGVDPNAQYTVTVTWPNPTGVSFALNSPNEFFIYADGEQVGKVVPPDRVEQFTFDVPRSVTADGRVQISLRKVPERSRCTCVSEIWLRKKKS